MEPWEVISWRLMEMFVTGMKNGVYLYIFHQYFRSFFFMNLRLFWAGWMILEASCLTCNGKVEFERLLNLTIHLTKFERMTPLSDRSSTKQKEGSEDKGQWMTKAMIHKCTLFNSIHLYS